MFPFLPRTASAKDGSDITIRTVRPGDAEQIYEMTRRLAEAGEGIVRTVDEIPGSPEATAVGLRRWLRERRGLYVVAERNTLIVGQADVRVPPLKRLAHAGTFTVAVHPRWQGSGVGRILTLATMEWSRDAGLDHLRLAVCASNEKARRLYESVGYIEEGIRQRYIRGDDGTFDDDVSMIWRPPPHQGPVGD